MIKFLNYLKYIGIYILVLLGITILISLTNLLGINNIIINKIIIILSAISLFIICVLASKKINEKGFIVGLILSITFIILITLINLIFIRNKINFDRIIYYLILIMVGALGGSLGKNLKIKKLSR